MSAVFGHGRLRLYLLKLLDDGPKHGYEFIRLLEERFLGLYAPSAGTIYPRLQRLETEGRVRHTAAGGRKVYEITDAGRAELRQRADELATLESDISASINDLSGLAEEIRTEVHGSVRDLKRELREAARQTRRVRPGANWPTPPRPDVALDRRLGGFVAEVRRLLGPNPTAERVDALQRSLDRALDELRRLPPA